MEFEQRYRAMETRDEGLVGEFFAAVTSTGIYCRPGCPARTPKRENVRFYLAAAAARAATGSAPACGVTPTMSRSRP